MAFKGGLSFNLGRCDYSARKRELWLMKGNANVEQIMDNYNMGFITYNERYNQIIDTWTHVNSRSVRYFDEATCLPIIKDSTRYS